MTYYAKPKRECIWKLNSDDVVVTLSPRQKWSVIKYATEIFAFHGNLRVRINEQKYKEMFNKLKGSE